MTRKEKEREEVRQILLKRERVSHIQMKKGTRYIFDGYSGLSEVGFVKREYKKFIYYGVLNGSSQEVTPSPVSRFVELSDEEFIKYFGRF